MKIVQFKTGTGGGIGFYKGDDIELSRLLNLGVNECADLEDDFLTCGSCVPCKLNHEVEEWNIIGYVDDDTLLTTLRLHNYKDIFYWYGGDCC